MTTQCRAYEDFYGINRFGLHGIGNHHDGKRYFYRKDHRCSSFDVSVLGLNVER